MVLVDTSVWIDHLRAGDEALVDLLNRGVVCMHPLIIGELACGYLKNRVQLISLWRDLPQVLVASDDEVMLFIEGHKLMGKGIGYVDMHLLAATLLSDDTRLWTRDKRLMGVAETLGVGF